MHLGIEWLSDRVSSRVINGFIVMLVVCVVSVYNMAIMLQSDFVTSFGTPIPAAVGFEIRMLNPLKNPSEVEIDAGRAILEPLAPLVLKIDACNGLTNQRLALIDGIVIGVVLGMQLVLPDKLPFNGVELAGIQVYIPSQQLVFCVFTILLV